MERALDVSIMAFNGELDYNGLPSVLHSIAVAESLPSVYCNMGTLEKSVQEDMVTVALLHDVLEDTDFTIEDIKEHIYINTDVEEALIAITKKDEEEYFEYIKRLTKCPLACLIKKADILHNLSREGKEELKNNKYYKALGMVEFVLQNNSI